MYADDTLLIEKGETQEALIRACQESLEQIVLWCKLNRLTINTDKTKSISVCPISKENNIVTVLNISGTQLQNVHEYEYHGVLIDERRYKQNYALCVNLVPHISETTALKFIKH